MIGQTILHYKIFAKLGEGGMGEVYLAEDTKLERKVALKFLPQHLSTNPKLQARFQREAKAAAALNHSNIITVYEIGEHEGRAYIAMEYVEGQSLRELMSQSELPEDRIIDILSQVCEGLSKAHQAGIVHRDLKPENIMLDADGKVRILDFGLAKLKGKSKLSFTKSTMGTVSYMAPEQCEGAEVDHRADIWAIGVMLYEMVAGKLPFDGEHEAAIIYAIVNQEPEPLARHKTSVSPDVQRIVDKALDKDRETRYRDINELLADLDRVKNIEAVSAKPMGRLRKKKMARSLMRYTVFAAFFVLLTVTVYYFWGNKPVKRIPVEHKQVTFVGDASWPAISPDGQFIAYVSGRELSEQKAMVQDLAGGQALKVFADRSVDRLRWSPDGAELLLGNYDSTYHTTLVPRLGGHTRRISTGGFMCWSPDGSQIASTDQPTKTILITNKKTNQIASLAITASFTFLAGIDWSPSGDRLVIAVRDEKKYMIRTMKIDGSHQHKVVDDSLELFSPRWSSDGKSIYFVRSESDGQTRNLMKVRIDTESGMAQEMPSIVLAGLPFGDFFQLSRDNKRLLYTRESHTRNLWLVTLNEETDSIAFDTKQLTTGTSWINDPAISPDGKQIVFSVGKFPRAELYSMPIAGRQMQQLTFMNAFSSGAAWSPDGEEIAFGAMQGGKNKVWRINSNGGTPLSFSKSELSQDPIHLTWAPDSSLLYQRPDNRNFHFLDPVTEEERPLVSSEFGWIFFPRFSPDGKIVALYGNEFSLKKFGLWLVFVVDGSRKFLQPGLIFPMKWSNDGEWIWAYTADTKQTKILKIPADGRQSQVLVTLPWEERVDYNIRTVAMSPDEKHLVVPVTHHQSDVWLVEHFDPENELEAPTSIPKVPEMEQLSYLQEGAELRRQRKYAEAEARFRKGLAMNSEHLELLNSLGWSLLLQRKYPEAERVFSKGLKIAPDYESIWDGIGQAAIENKNYRAAKQYNEKYLQRISRPERKVPVQAELGTINILLRDFAQAEKRFRGALAIDSTNAQSLGGLGYLFTLQERYADAEKYAMKALRLDSSFANYNLAAWMLVSGEIDIERGIAFAEKALAFKPEDWQKSIEIYPYLAIPEHTLGLAYLKKGEHEKAVQYLEQAAAFAPERHAIQDDLQSAKRKLQKMKPK